VRHLPRYSTLPCGTRSCSHDGQERERAAEAAATQADHDILMSKINELSVYRESNATLRVEGEAKGKRVTELDAKLRQVTEELAPAKQELLVLRAELDARDSQITRLTQDNRKWQERNQQLLTKVQQPFSFPRAHRLM
jgi:nucleoprotein TPR